MLAYYNILPLLLLYFTEAFDLNIISSSSSSLLFRCSTGTRRRCTLPSCSQHWHGRAVRRFDLHSTTSNGEHQKEQHGDSEKWTGHRGTSYRALPSMKDKVFQTMQLATTIWMLLLLPARVYTSTWDLRVLGLLPLQYFLLFAVGTLPRQWRFGSSKRQDNPKLLSGRGKRGTRRRDFILFQICLFACHWLAVRDYFVAASPLNNVVRNSASFWNSIGAAVRWLAIVLNGTSAWVLGRAYDRVVRPDHLVTSGPYAVMRHPIYTSYLLLFGSALLWPLGSLRSFLAFVMSAAWFYSGRMAAEEEILRGAFPEDWENYVRRVPFRLLPCLPVL